jgi:hypothetical protein
VREALSFASGSECHQRQSRLRTCSFLPSLCCAAQHVKGQITFASSRFMRLEAQSAATCILRDGRPLPPSGPVQAVSHLARRPCCTTLHQTHDARWSPLVLMIAGTCPWKSFSTPICHHVFFFPCCPALPTVCLGVLHSTSDHARLLLTMPPRLTGLHLTVINPPKIEKTGYLKVAMFLYTQQRTREYTPCTCLDWRSHVFQLATAIDPNYPNR